MKKIIFSFIVMATVLACSNPTSTTNTSEAEKVPDKSELANLGDRIVIDTDSSLVFWKGTKPTGDIHVGTVNIKEGILYIANGNVKGGMFVMDMNSILVTDEDMSEKGKRKLKKHLTNEDFFETNNFPEAILEITSSTADSLTANLEIKNITKSITIPYSLTKANGRITANSSFSIDRTLWGITYKSGNFFSNLANRLIDDAIQFEIKLSGKE
ncbi:YceI family protein [Bacteroidia bacterium]|nr:YceI family protein [Bacteroidia bacterium]MDC0560458.1 YceI family protein [Bacteroidia bacterium]